MVLKGKGDTVKSSSTTANESSNQLPRRLSTSQKVRDFFNLGSRTQASPEVEKSPKQTPVSRDQSRSQAFSTDRFKNISMVAYLMKQQEQSKRKKEEKVNVRATERSKNGGESAGMGSSRRHGLFHGVVYNSLAETGKPINKQMISAPLTAQSSLGHERPPRVPLKEERDRERVPLTDENLAHVYTWRAATGVEDAKGRPLKSRSMFRSRSFQSSSSLSTFPPPRTSSPARRAPRKYRKSEPCSRLGFYMGTSADAMDATRRDLNKSVCRLGSYMGTSADVLDATRREVAANIWRSTEKVVSIVRSSFERSGYESGSDSDESFYCIGVAEKSTKQLYQEERGFYRQGTDLLASAQQHECRMCCKTQPAGWKGLCCECQRRFRGLKTDPDGDNEKGKLGPPMPLNSEARSPSAWRIVKESSRTAKGSQLVPVLQIFPNSFVDQHEISLASSVPTTERPFRSITSSAHTRLTPAAPTPHHTNLNDPVSPISPISPLTPDRPSSPRASPANATSATQYVSSYEQRQAAELRAEYKRFETCGPHWPVPARSANSGAGGGTGGSTTALAWPGQRGGLQTGERLYGGRRGEAMALTGLVETRYHGFI
jgi:hypothetical protein